MRGDAGASQGPFVVDDLVDVAPAGPATAHNVGVILVDKTNELHIARRGPLASGPVPTTSPVASLDLPREAFAPYGRGPAVALDHAYWVQHNRLLRRRLDGVGELEVLAEDARRGTRVAAAGTRATGALVAYVTTPRPSSPEPDAVSAARARVWIEGGKIHDVTPDGAGTSSVALVPQASGAMLLALDGRSGMTPLHARRLRVENKKLLLGPDVVAWVGASAQSTTEVIGAARTGDIWALVAIERDVLHFGVAQIHIGKEPRLDVPATFVTFANGANTSPIAAAEFCGKTAVVFAQPASSAPGSPQELVLAELGPDGLTRGEIIVRSKAFADASLAPVSGGALLCYTADHRTWAATVRCRP